MRVFITGASGYLGGAVAEHLITAGHTVTALTRSDEAATRVSELGATPLKGSLEDLGVLRSAAAATEAVVHAAVDYVNPKMQEIEQAALTALLEGSPAGTRFIYTSTGFVYPDTHGVPVTEDFPVTPETSGMAFKVHGERQVLATGQVSASIIRAALIYGRGGSGLLQGMIATARQSNVVTYIGDGANTWSSVHIDDLAALYVAALERTGDNMVVNAASGESTSMRHLAEAVAQLTGAQATSITLEQAQQAMGAFASNLTRSSPLDVHKVREVLGWKHGSPSLLEEISAGSYS
jgi:nucleoside-diphosphate-sugar epimerase